MTPNPFWPSLAELLVSSARGIAYFGLIAGRTVAQIVLDIIRAFPRANPLDAQSVVFRVREAMAAAEEFGSLRPGETLPVEDIPISPSLQNPLPGSGTPAFETTVVIEYRTPDGETRYITERIYTNIEPTADDIRAMATSQFSEFAESHPDSVPGATSAESVIQDIHIQQIWRRE